MEDAPSTEPATASSTLERFRSSRSFGKILAGELDFSDMAIGDLAIAEVQKVVERERGPLKTLILDRVGLTDQGLKDLAPFLQETKSLETLRLNSNLPGPTALQGEFSEAIGLSTLKTLELTGCDLRDEGIKPLCEALQRWDDSLKELPGLQKLVISCNRIGLEGAKSIATMLGTNTHLKELVVRGNDFGPEGGEVLAQGVLDNKGRVQRIDASSCHLQERGATALVEAVLKTEFTTVLRLKKRTRDKIGLSLDPDMVVLGLEANSLAMKWGLDYPVEAVKRKDRLAAVNGATEPEDIRVQLMESEGDFELTMVRATPGVLMLDLSHNHVKLEAVTALREKVCSPNQGFPLGWQLLLDNGRRRIMLNAA